MYDVWWPFNSPSLRRGVMCVHVSATVRRVDWRFAGPACLPTYLPTHCVLISQLRGVPAESTPASAGYRLPPSFPPSRPSHRWVDVPLAAEERREGASLVAAGHPVTSSAPATTGRTRSPPVFPVPCFRVGLASPTHLPSLRARLAPLPPSRL